MTYVTNKVFGKSEQYNDLADLNHQNVSFTHSYLLSEGEHACNYVTQTFHLPVNLITQPGLIICSAGTWQVSCLYSVAGNYTVARCSRLCPIWSHSSMEHTLPDAPCIMR
jgi:hypothetical protein